MQNRNKENTKKFYAAKNKDIEIRKNSTSGGIFMLLAQYILKKNGIIYGAAYTENFEVSIIRVGKEEELKRLQGVKYVQSNMEGVYEKIYKDLINEKIVLFTGLPCQCFAIKKYLENKNVNISNLYLCDLVCHGVPSFKIWKEYLCFLEKKYNSNIKYYKFRYKKVSWRGHNIFIKFNNNKEIINSYALLSYTNLYSRDLIIRESCFVCKFSNLNRTGDITIGDCWGIEKANKEFDDNNGVSLVIINNIKGKNFFNKIKDNIDYIELNERQCLQKNLVQATKKPMIYDEFWKSFYNNGYEYIAKKYSNYGIKNRIIFKTKEVLKKSRILRNIAMHITINK